MKRSYSWIGVAIAFFVIGNTTGFLAGLMTTNFARKIFDGMFTQETAARVDTPAVYERPGFRFSYPGNWSIDREDESFDPDHQIGVESPGASFALIFIFEQTLDPEAALAEFLPGYEKVLSDVSHTPFERWGRLAGQGMALRGRLIGNAAWLRVFVHSAEDRTLLVVTQTFDDDLEQVRPGFELIASSFAFRDDDPTSGR